MDSMHFNNAQLATLFKLVTDLDIREIDFLPVNYKHGGTVRLLNPNDVNQESYITGYMLKKRDLAYLKDYVKKDFNGWT